MKKNDDKKMNIKLKDNESLNITSGGSEISLNDFVRFYGTYNSGIRLTPKGSSGPTGYDDGSILFSNINLYIAQRNDGLSIEDNDWDTRYLFPKDRNGTVALQEDHYTKAEIDTKIGDIETLLANI